MHFMHFDERTISGGEVPGSLIYAALPDHGRERGDLDHGRERRSGGD